MEESTADFNCKSRVKEWLIEIKEKTEPYPASKCNIYKVPKDIRSINADAYTPKVISIGPLHHGKVALADMENLKKIYVKSFLDRIPAEDKAEKEEEIITFVQNNEQLIRASYAKTIYLESPKFVRMIISDALFIIEHFVRNFYVWGDDYHFLRIPVVVQSALSLDLYLLENQLPYFILKGIYNLLRVDEEVTFLQISIRFFRNAFDLDIYDLPEEPEHFTDLIRIALVKSCPKVVEKGPIRDLPCAQELRKSGIKFKNAGRGLLDVRFQERQWLIPSFKMQKLCIPRFTVYNFTESLLGNVMALEQCRYPFDTTVCNYVILMNYLMKTNEDVELLVAAGIISNVYVEDAEVANMFNKLGSQIMLDENSSYHDICEELKNTHGRRWNKNKATLWRVITDPVTGIATMIAVLALVFTFIQTICSLRQLKWS